jgi:hypothetical protein
MAHIWTYTYMVMYVAQLDNVHGFAFDTICDMCTWSKSHDVQSWQTTESDHDTIKYGAWSILQNSMKPSLIIIIITYINNLLYL